MAPAGRSGGSPGDSPAPPQPCPKGDESPQWSLFVSPGFGGSHRVSSSNGNRQNPVGCNPAPAAAGAAAGCSAGLTQKSLWKMRSNPSDLPRDFRSSAQSIKFPQGCSLSLGPDQPHVHTIHTPFLEASWEWSLCCPVSLKAPGISRERALGRTVPGTI